MKLKPHVRDVLLTLGLGALVVGSAVAPGLPKIIYFLVKKDKKDGQKLARFDHRLLGKNLRD